MSAQLPPELRDRLPPALQADAAQVFADPYVQYAYEEKRRREREEAKETKDRQNYGAAIALGAPIAYGIGKWGVPKLLDGGASTVQTGAQNLVNTLSNAAGGGGTATVAGTAPGVPTGLFGQQIGGVSGIGPVASGTEYASLLNNAPGPGIGSYVLPAAGAALGAYGLYDVLSGDGQKGEELSTGLQGLGSGAALGASIGSVVPGVGTLLGGAVGAGLGGLAGAAQSLFGSGKSERERARDTGRDYLQMNFPQMYTDDAFIATQGGGWDTRLGPEAERINVDWGAVNANPALAEGVGSLNALMLATMPGEFRDVGGQNIQSAMVGEFMNAATQGGGDPSANIAAQWAASGLDRNQAASNVWRQFQEGNINEWERNAALAAIDAQFGVVNPNQGRGGVEEYGAAYIDPEVEAQQREAIRQQQRSEALQMLEGGSITQQQYDDMIEAINRT